MITEIDHIYHALFFMKPNDRHNYLRSQLPGVDVGQLLRRYRAFPKIYRNDLAHFTVLVNGKQVGVYGTRQEALVSAKKQPTGRVVIVDVPISEMSNPQYDNYYQDVIREDEVVVPVKTIELEPLKTQEVVQEATTHIEYEETKTWKLNNLPK